MAIKFLNTVQVDTDVLYVDASTNKVGIGTASPLNKLQVTGGSIGIDSQYMIRDNRNNTILLQSANTAASNRSLTIGNASYSNIIVPNGNVGIGTTSPDSKLHIYANNADAPTVVKIENGDVGVVAGQDLSKIEFLTNDASAPGAGVAASIRTVCQNAGNIFDLAFNTQNGPTRTERMRLDGAGNLGIGTTTPITSLTLGTGSSGISFQSSSTTLNSGKIAVIKQIELGNGNGNLTFETYQGGSGGGERMRILNNGNVGIGTDSPGAKLDVSGGDIRLRSNATYIKSTDSNGTETRVLGISSSNTTYIGPIEMYQGGGIIYGNSPNVTYHGFYGGGSEKVRINSNGNVGIGTTNPGAKLDVDGNIIVSGGVSNENDGARVTSPGGASFITQTSSVAGAIKITLPQAGINTMMRMEVKVYEYLTNESFTVQCGGYSAGTSQWYNEYAYIESSAKDDRNFTVRFGYDGSKSCIYIGELTSAWSYPQVFVTEFQGGYLNTTGYKDSWDISFEASAFQGVTKTQANTQINNWARSGTNTYYASSTGNVGIGTTTPYSKLQVASAAGSDVPTAGNPTGGLFVSNTNKSYGINMGVAGAGWSFIQSQRADGSTTLYDLNLQPLGGNVGIGTLFPSEKLEVTGTIKSNVIQTGLNLSMFTSFGINFIAGGNGTTIRFGAPSSYVQNVYVQGALQTESSIQYGSNASAASAALVGSQRYRTNGNNSYVDVCMQTGASTYTWVNIVTNSW